MAVESGQARRVQEYGAIHTGVFAGLFGEVADAHTSTHTG